MTALPSGEQYEISSGALRATVVEVGGALRTLHVGDRPLLDGYPPEAICTGARGQSLLPWPNRVDGGRYSFAGTRRQLALTEPDRGNAIHGLARWVPWQVLARAADRVTMGYRIHPQPGYPHTVELRIDYRLSGDGLDVQTTATNTGPEPAPFGAGAHPYLRVAAATIDDARLHVPAARWLLTDDRGIPTDLAPVAGSPYDFREPRRIGDLHIDYAYTELDRDPDGRARLTLTGPAGESVRLWQDPSYPWLEVFTGDTLPMEERRRGLGVEPMSCPPNAFVSGTDVVTLAPGQSWTGSWGVEVG